ncbi:SDR family oxidoreductase [Terrabacter sp. MAHUQ-38]|uniref:SDR family oxidoreductase n=1 Tax=unclassified Terrabacter TaxID=2630222 RepID=UPI00165DC0C9|nr:SDR family oxidoreductase [Terrabacter sp. MAHUQ-38]MBC9820734.1 SDR family oxidoreductase [Terrabacter sp. MAHUQ-38]
MKVVVIGGTGLIGSKVVAKLNAHGHEAIPASPDSGVNTLTGEGLADVLVGADVVVDVSNSPSFADDDVMSFFRTSTGNLLAAEQQAGVTHHVALSIVGSERVPDSGYLRAKVAQEQLITESGIPYSLVRATQFFEFVGAIAQAATVDGVVHIAPVWFQPIAAEDVATFVARTAAGEPLEGTVEVGGPERVRFDDFIREVLADRGDVREVVTDSRARYFGAELGDEDLVPGPGATLSQTTFADWASTQVIAVQ